MKYQRFTPSGCKYIGIRKFETQSKYNKSYYPAISEIGDNFKWDFINQISWFYSDSSRNIISVF